MSDDRDILEEIRSLIQDETLYLRHFIGEIVDVQDIQNKGRVKVSIHELGLNTPALGIWCNPRQSNSLSVPKVGQYAEVYFINGDRSRPAYLYPVSEVIGNTPTKYSGNPLNHVLFEDPNDSVKNIKIEDGILVFFDGTESIVLGDAFLTWLTNYINAIYNVHVHTGGTLGGGLTGVPSVVHSPPSGILSVVSKVK